jgi:tetratricopeptide (TPR) repeat protein
MAGLAYQSLLENRKAARQYAQLAETAEAAGQLDTTVEMHLRIRELLPVEINSRLEAARDRGARTGLLKPYHYDVLVETIEVALILREIGRGEESTKLLRETMNRFVQQTPAALRLADLAIELGDQRSAVETLLSVGERLVQRSDLDSALRLYRRVKAMDPAHPTVSHRMQALQARLDGGQRKQRRRTGGFLVRSA